MSQKVLEFVGVGNKINLNCANLLRCKFCGEN
jgi:hypothetical protein